MADLISSSERVIGNSLFDGDEVDKEDTMGMSYYDTQDSQTAKDLIDSLTTLSPFSWASLKDVQ